MEQETVVRMRIFSILMENPGDYFSRQLGRQIWILGDLFRRRGMRIVEWMRMGTLTKL